MGRAHAPKTQRRFNLGSMTDEEFELLISAENRAQWDQWSFLCESQNGSEAYWEMKDILTNNRNRFTEQPTEYIGTSKGKA